MKYDEGENKLKISAREFISIARRGISGTLPYDEDEPELSPAGGRLLSKILPDAKKEELIYTECFGDYLFEICAHAEKICDMGELCFTASGKINPKKPNKDFSAQLRGEGYIAAYIYSKLAEKSDLKLTFIYINSDTGEHCEISEITNKKKLLSFFERCLKVVSIYAAPEIDRVTKRLPSMKGIRFPYTSIREGQAEFVRAAYRNIARGGTLYAIAPTGTGKTVSALYPAIRAMGDGRRDKTFYFTPKETTAIAAKECLELMAESGLICRSVIISAKEKRCKRGLLCRDSRKLCDASKCNMLKEAVLSLYNKKIDVVTGADIDSVAKEYTVCPYELSLAYSELCDIVICDFNYLFDPIVYIKRFFTSGGNYTFLIDEAHNLPDRAREIYSAEICYSDISSAFENSPLGEKSATRGTSLEASNAFTNILLPYVKEEIRKDSDGKSFGAAHLSDIPSELFAMFEKLKSTAENEMLENFSSKDEEKEKRIKFLRSYLYKTEKFLRVMEAFDSSYEMFVFFNDGEIRAKLYCIDTGKEISKRLSKGEAAVLFSATLTPLYYYKALLGGDGSTDSLEVNSPFDESQLSVNIMDKISTRYSEREDTEAAVIKAIAATVSAKRGNYMVFTPSFAYAEALSKMFSSKYPKIKVILQKKNMSTKEKSDFLKEFTTNKKSYLIAFCVMGGIYSEGIDLAGDSLIGAVIVGIGLPGLSYEREAIAAYYDEKYEEGKQFAYIYPGMNRVLQAAGRVIRREDDKGVIVLIDDRFADPIYKKIIPKLWRGMKFTSDAKELRADLDAFWNEDKNL